MKLFRSLHNFKTSNLVSHFQTNKSNLSSSLPKLYNFGGVRFYRQCKDLNEIMFTHALEENQRTEKFLEYTHKVYKPSKTITFDRNGEVLLFSSDSWRHVISLYHYYNLILNLLNNVL